MATLAHIAIRRVIDHSVVAPCFSAISGKRANDFLFPVPQVEPDDGELIARTGSQCVQPFARGAFDVVYGHRLLPCRSTVRRMPRPQFTGGCALLLGR